MLLSHMYVKSPGPWFYKNHHIQALKKTFIMFRLHLNTVIDVWDSPDKKKEKQKKKAYTKLTVDF